MKVSKTNAMRILDSKKIPYEIITYESKDGKIDGVSVAEKIGKDVRSVYKTLVAQGNSKNIYVYIIPVNDELDLKKGAKAVNEKKIEMIPVKDIQKWTGYIRGGCSPIGMKKVYPTVIDESAEGLEKIIVSGGKIGVQLELTVGDLKEVTNAMLVDVIK
ncbi:aminoacyl-tRNA deacylase [Sutcliffiella cohnii]|uniref:Cys-tRNA(Pro)/Cys-tRNA(Cys) deacylase n=1 Tax=Sutcliffiella cohnii TaxID=33932 RepID=A0A223KL42_9BACI|nr:Cys-tRNA(Pro) deacylase [Sutcliffiella cohnii]AST90210.1 aminoacyl-tRNA deacylase [Sutcliffiella cohnii]